MSEFTEYEREHAIQEAHMIHSENEYFQARPQLESDHNRRIFDAGFQRGYKALTQEIDKLRAQLEAEQAKIEKLAGHVYMLKNVLIAVKERQDRHGMSGRMLPEYRLIENALTATQSDVEAYLAERDVKVLEEAASRCTSTSGKMTLLELAAERKKKGEQYGNV